MFLQTAFPHIVYFRKIAKITKSYLNLSVQKNQSFFTLA
ncbi:hypothetical protein CHCC20441_1591 [Bacillus licheniformis]|uniref:Uncharacterized protein n=1 Tax=Bacillus licheniformis TaxID=1402 RepID=A0A8B5Y8R5_BACLI|nr:hypothetical protein B4092_2823 [Bacillus licheniformis]TWN16051.1 hypothetical protein CHCC14564_0616 [Bacillus licheniformis LMG 17339]KYC76171.1 hypothetical protein B4090_2857 [Bacillus licheniformis]KYC81107.1 hypothetical protein B4091_3126 [Bacillus licheniformis]KYC96531.1 hypothetical protein B4164_2976 [Bacillus licheniformis]